MVDNNDMDVRVISSKNNLQSTKIHGPRVCSKSNYQIFKDTKYLKKTSIVKQIDDEQNKKRTCKIM